MQLNVHQRVPIYDQCSRLPLRYVAQGQRQSPHSIVVEQVRLMHKCGNSSLCQLQPVEAVASKPAR
eukprot:5530569-Amphidinium_carterae.1